MSTRLSIFTMNNGAVVEAVDAVLDEIAANIADVNTIPDKARELTLKIKIKPDKSRVFQAATVVVTSKLQPQEPQEITMVLDKHDKKPALFESFAGQDPRQGVLLGTSRDEIISTREPVDTIQNVTPFRRTAAQ